MAGRICGLWCPTPAFRRICRDRRRSFSPMTLLNLSSRLFLPLGKCTPCYKKPGPDYLITTSMSCTRSMWSFQTWDDNSVQRQRSQISNADSDLCTAEHPSHLDGSGLGKLTWMQNHAIWQYHASTTLATVAGNALFCWDVSTAEDWVVWYNWSSWSDESPRNPK